MFKFVPYQGTNKTVFKTMEKKQKYNQEIVAYLSEKFGVSTRYVRAGLSGHNKSTFADTIKKEYKVKQVELTKLLSL